jgi:thiol-disulfide isomerase/thioredoxin
MSDDYAGGDVHSLTMGSAELQLILQSAARRSQLVLVDFSASWCGPCRMMLPVLQQLARDHRGRLAVVKVSPGLLPRHAHWKLAGRRTVLTT